MECIVVHTLDLGEWTAIFGEIAETHVDEDKVDQITGNIDISKVDPLIYCATIREYWRLGKRIGKGFNAGRHLQQNSAVKDG